MSHAGTARPQALPGSIGEEGPRGHALTYDPAQLPGAEGLSFLQCSHPPLVPTSACPTHLLIRVLANLDRFPQTQVP